MYPKYHIDRAWYNKNKHYSDMWRQRDIFETTGNTLKQHQDELIVLFKKFINFSDKYHLQWWATGGTLLGTIREGKIIEWDDDIDIEISSDAISFMKTKKEELSLNGMIFEKDDHIWRIRYLSPSSKAYIDIFEVQKAGDRWMYTEKENIERWPKSYFLDEELFPLKTYRFGELLIKGPALPESYLERQYGNWKTPVKEKGHIF